MNALALFGALNNDEIIKIVMVFVVIFFSLIGRIIAGMRAPQRPANPPPPALPPQQPQKPQPQAERPKSVKDEIDDFLRRAAQKKQSTSSAAGPIRRISQPTAPLAQREEPVQAEAVRDRPVGGAVSAHVSKYLDEKEFAERASKLGGEVAAADTKIEQHLKEVFGHGISKLAAQPGETATPSTPMSLGVFQDEVPVMAAAGTGLAVLLNNIDNLRQAIVVNEILQRPIDRWK